MNAELRASIVSNLSDCSIYCQALLRVYPYIGIAEVSFSDIDILLQRIKQGIDHAYAAGSSSPIYKDGLTAIRDTVNSIVAEFKNTGILSGNTVKNALPQLIAAIDAETQKV